MDRLRSMQVFASVVEHGSFVAAADALDLSRPMASKHVKQLETSLGVRLLNRTTRTVSLTEAGRTFYRRCQTIFAEIDAAVAEASDLQVKPRGILRINAPISFGCSPLTPALARFQDRYPDIGVELTLDDHVVDLVDEGYDVAIRIGRLADSTLIARKLAPCTLKVCVSPEYLDQRGQPTSPEDLVDHNCLIYAYSAMGRTWTFSRKRRKFAVSVDGDFRANFGQAVVEAATCGRGIVFEPDFLVRKHLADGSLVHILTDYSTPEYGIYAVHAQNRLVPRKVRILIDWLVDAFTTLPT